jgi:hypothetical protein
MLSCLFEKLIEFLFEQIPNAIVKGQSTGATSIFSVRICHPHFAHMFLNAIRPRSDSSGSGDDVLPRTFDLVVFQTVLFHSQTLTYCNFCDRGTVPTPTVLPKRKTRSHIVGLSS